MACRLPGTSTYWELDPRATVPELSSRQRVLRVFSQGQAISDAAGMTVELELAWADACRGRRSGCSFYAVHRAAHSNCRIAVSAAARLLSFATTTIKLVFYGSAVVPRRLLGVSRSLDICLG